MINHIKNLSDIPVKTANDIGLNANAIEAECFAWLGVRSICGLPLSLPSITGVSKPTLGGELFLHHKEHKS
jgi:anhydro-N-acetylmuramic acid kinase